MENPIDLFNAFVAAAGWPITLFVLGFPMACGFVFWAQERFFKEL